MKIRLFFRRFLRSWLGHHSLISIIQRQISNCFSKSRWALTACSDAFKYQKGCFNFENSLGKNIQTNFDCDCMHLGRLLTETLFVRLFSVYASINILKNTLIQPRYMFPRSLNLIIMFKIKFIASLRRENQLWASGHLFWFPIINSSNYFDPSSNEFSW